MNDALHHPAIGKYCIVRCTTADVHAGIVTAVTSDRVTLENSRRLWFWKTRKGISLSAVALYGVSASDSRIPAALPQLHLERHDVCEFIEANDDAR